MRPFLLLTLALSLYANDAQDLVLKAYENNPSLEKLKLQIKASDYKIKNADIYKNPILSLGLNDINLDEPKNRDLEAMQTNYINYSQEITSNDKLKQKTKITQIDKEIFSQILIDKKNQITKDIYLLAYNIKQLKEKIKLNKQKIANIKKIQTYHNNHLEHKRAFQVTLQNDYMIDSISLNLLQDEQKIKEHLSKLSELVNIKIKDVNINNKFTFVASIKSHTLLKIQELYIKQAKAKQALAKANESANITISAGYYQRQEFDDYVNFAVKFPLNIYNKETNELQISLKQIDIAKTKYEQTQNTLEKFYEIELSKNTLAQKSMKYLKKIKNHLLKEKQLIINQNTKDSLVELLFIENKIIENEIKYLNNKKNYDMSSVNLAYLTNNL